MSVSLSRRFAGLVLVLGVVALGAAVVALFAISTPDATAAAGPPKAVKASRITRRSGTLAPGTAVSSASLGQRVFTDVVHGFALANAGGAQYPAATSDGGATWRTDGPALHVNAAQAPLAVANIGAASQAKVFAYGGGQVIDTTRDGGQSWYRALFSGLVMAVVRGVGGRLVAFVDASVNGRGVTWQYVSRDGGRTWRYNPRVGAF
jgi:hypothetical protein